MSASDIPIEEIARRGREWYEREIRPALEPSRKGDRVVINVETGEYVVDRNDVAAAKLASKRFPGAPLFAMRVGARAMYRMGGRLFSRRTGD